MYGISYDEKMQGDAFKYMIADDFEEEKAKLEKYQGMMAQVKERLSQLGADRSDLV